MAMKPTRLEVLYEAMHASRVQPYESMVEAVEEQLDHDIRGGWGDLEDRVLDDRDPRSVLLEFTSELDGGLVAELEALAPADRTLVEREVRRRYLEAGYHSLTFLDEGRVRLEHILGPGGAAGA